MGPLRVPLSPLASGERALDEDAARYVVRVHRLRAGALLALFDPFARTEADGVVLAAGRDAVRVMVRDVRPSSSLPRRAVTLLQAVAKGDKMDAIVRDATELGATRIVAMTTKRSVAEGARAKARWERIAVEAARQSGRGDIPAIDEPRPFSEALRGLSESLRVSLAPGATRTLGDVVTEYETEGEPAGEARPDADAEAAPAADGRRRGSLAIAVGPEGGFDEAELATLTAQGFVLASLGPFVLRTETAGPAALAVIADRFASLSARSLPLR